MLVDMVYVFYNSLHTTAVVKDLLQRDQKVQQIRGTDSPVERVDQRITKIFRGVTDFNYGYQISGHRLQP